MKVVLSTSPHIKHSAVLEADFQPRGDLMYTFAPLGLLSLCAAARKQNDFTPILYDLNDRINKNFIQNNNSFYEEAATDILRLDPDVVGFMSECDSYHHVLQICAAIKKTDPGCYIILGGPHATAVAEATLRSWECIDCIVLGEGERSFPDLISALQKGERTVIPGTVMRDVDGIPRRGVDRPLVESLDDLPLPAYDLYTPLPGEEIFIEAGRGCPFQCTFCSTSPFWQRKHRVKSASRIVDEIRYVKSLFDVARVHFTHDLFTANAQWVKTVCTALIEANVPVKWTCSSRVDTIDEELITLMSKAGCNAIFFGVESGSNRILKEIEKNISFNQTVQAIEWCYKHSITPNVGLIVGFPFDDAESFSDTFKAYTELIKKRAKPIHLFSYCPFVQSSLYGSLKDLKCSGHFLDIPLSKQLDQQNRQLVKSDFELFGSYFKPQLAQKIPGLADGVLYAIDEFALLVDATCFPSTEVAELVGGMDQLFFHWIDFIRNHNERMGKAKDRIYFGSPADFCEFLLQLHGRFDEAPGFIKELVLVYQKNFAIAQGLRTKQPTTMASYKSKTLPQGLYQLSMQTRIHSDSLIDLMKVHYDLSPFLDNRYPQTTSPDEKELYLVWQKTSESDVSLITVSRPLFQLLQQSLVNTVTVKEMLGAWMGQEAPNENVQEFFDNLETAYQKNLISLND